MVRPAFDEAYFKRWYRPGRLLRYPIGDKPFFYAFWTRFLRKLLAPGSRILELGCGLGSFLNRIEASYRTIGLDVSAAALKEARSRTRMTMFVRATAEMLPFRDEQFDIVQYLWGFLPYSLGENYVCVAAKLARGSGS